MRRLLDRYFSATSPSRLVLDGAWVLGFAVAIAVMWLEARSFRPFQSSVNLALIEGSQRRGIYREGRRLGQVLHKVERRARGWRVTERFALASSSIGTVTLELREDLSLARMSADIDISRVTRLSGMNSTIARFLGGEGRLVVRGDCSSGSGDCLIQGQLAGRRMSHVLSVGRGPVLPSAIYPLLARGILGRQVELNLLDPMSLQRRVVTFTLIGRETVGVAGKQVEALLVRQQFAGLDSKIWLDGRGLVLKEQLPLGLWAEHEAWSESG